MKIVIAIDSFKGSVSSIEGSAAIAEGIRDVCPDAEIVTLPLADGGEGTTEALAAATGGTLREVNVTGPLGEPVAAEYAIFEQGRKAAIEVAAACGLPLVPPAARNPLRTTTYGVGELIRDALAQGCREFVIGLGGSSTNDAGMGMLQALGYRFLDADGAEVSRGGAELLRVRAIDASGAAAALRDCVFRVACDVDNPLYGPEGAAAVFAPQKGADEAMVETLDQGLRQFAAAVEQAFGARIADVPGAGAAGGLGAAFAGLLGGSLQSGIGLVLDSIGMEAHLRDAHLVITGEGKLDGQTSRGKAPLGVAQLAQKHGVPVIALAGGVGKEAAALNEQGVTAYFSVVRGPMPLEEAMLPEETAFHLRTTTRQLFRLLRATGWQA